MTYRDPIPTVRALVGEPHPLWRGDLVRRDWSGPAPDGWQRRDWRIVPGPFCTAGADNCLTGRQCAPQHVAYEDEHRTEFVHRRPARTSGVHELTCAAECDPFGGYGGDGDRHWTPELVRARRILPVIARRGTPHGSGLGAYTWVVERTFARLHGFGRLRVHRERRAEGAALRARRSGELSFPRR